MYIIARNYKKVYVLSLIGQYDSKLNKNTIKLSDKHVSHIGSECVITYGYEKCLYVFDLKSWQKFITNLDALSFSKDVRNICRYFCANAENIDIISNTIYIPKRLQKYFKKDVVVLGVLDHLEIWDKDEYMNYDYGSIV